MRDIICALALAASVYACAGRTSLDAGASGSDVSSAGQELAVQATPRAHVAIGIETSVDASSPDGDRCDVGVFDPNHPPRALALSANAGHDPTIVAAHGQYYFFGTGNGISTKSSPDLLNWTPGPPVFSAAPAWFQRFVPAWPPVGPGTTSAMDIWAPDVSYFSGVFHLYYAVSSFGSPRSCIGHATRPALDAGNWTDHQAIFCSNLPGQSQDYNAIDANAIVDEAGIPWLVFGSFWSGIKMIRLERNGQRSGTEVHDIASRGGGAIEAPYIVRRCGYYYLFVSFDVCCAGVNSTYNIRVGRSPDVLGPYVDKDGTPMLSGGGTLVLAAGNGLVGPGHNAILIDGKRAYNVYHAYEATDGSARLHISELVWDSEGWPISGGP